MQLDALDRKDRIDILRAERDRAGACSLWVVTCALYFLCFLMNLGDTNMAADRVVLTAIVAVGVGFPAGTWAADTTWLSTKILEVGVPNNCGDKYPDYRIEINGNSFKATPVGGDSTQASTTTLNIKALNPDGSGKVTVTNKAGKTWNYEFAAGNGPRTVRYGNEFTSCRYAWKPK